MIFDSIHNIENYKENKAIYQALCYLKELQPEDPPQPGTVIEEGCSFCNPVSLTTKPESECIFEAHKNYADLHYIIKGSEKIATADVRSLTVNTPYDPDKDIAFYTGEKSGWYLLKEGDFMVCYPSDAHMVAMMGKEPEDVSKIVVKIKSGLV